MAQSALQSEDLVVAKAAKVGGPVGASLGRFLLVEGWWPRRRFSQKISAICGVRQEHSFTRFVDGRGVD